MTETNTQISVYDALLRDEPTILASVKNAVNGLLAQSFAFENKRASTDYLKAVRVFMDAIGFPGPDSYVFLNMSDAQLDNIFGARLDDSLLSLLPEPASQRVGSRLDILSVTGAQIADYHPRCAYALALADLEAELHKVSS